MVVVFDFGKACIDMVVMVVVDVMMMMVVVVKVSHPGNTPRPVMRV